MNIISTFMFSEPHEADLLYLKLSVEDPFIAKWVIVENSFTFQGNEKDLCLERVLNETRFEPFKHKIHIIIITQNYSFEYEPSFTLLLKRKIKRFLNKQLKKEKYSFVPYAELAAFYCEINQRQAVEDYIYKNFNKSDLVFPGDADEILDLNEGKLAAFLEIVQESDEPLYFHRKVFCYDFDNFTNRIRYSPIIRVEDLKKEKYSLHFFRHQLKKKIISSNYNFFYEYTFCFSKESIIKKLQTFAHVSGFGSSTVEYCLENNIALTNPQKISDVNLKNKEFFFEKKELSNQNSPLFLRQNYKEWLLNTVSSHYMESREKNDIVKKY